jgi:hypothetical protein
MQEQNPITGPTDTIVPSAQPLSTPTNPITNPTEPITSPKPITGSTKPVTNPTEPITSPKPITGSTKPVTGPTKPVTSPAKPVTGPTKPVTSPTKPVTGSLFVDSEISVLTQARISHVIVALTIILSAVISTTVLYGSDPNDDWARRWVLVAIPFVSAVGLCVAWRSAWRDILLGMATIYMFAPFIAARVESCWLPIPGAVPCFADNTVVLELASQLAHPIYYPVLIGLHLAGALFMWSLVASKGGQYAPSTGTTTD